MADREINAITLVVTDMARSVLFYERLGFETAYGGPDAAFTSLKIVNLPSNSGFDE